MNDGREISSDFVVVNVPEPIGSNPCPYVDAIVFDRTAAVAAGDNADPFDGQLRSEWELWRAGCDREGRRGSDIRSVSDMEAVACGPVFIETAVNFNVLQVGAVEVFYLTRHGAVVASHLDDDRLLAPPEIVERLYEPLSWASRWTRVTVRDDLLEFVDRVEPLYE